MFVSLARSRSLIVVCAVAACFTLAAWAVPTGPAGLPASYYTFDASGRLLKPTGYRQWVFVGTPLTPNDLNNGKAPFPEFHNVYMDPASWAAWKRTGELRDGAILIKELVSVGSKSAASGKGYFMGKYIGLEATIKSARRFPNEPGYWAYFSFTDEAQGAPHATATIKPTATCNACHQANAGKDWVFAQYYPVLTAEHALP